MKYVVIDVREPEEYVQDHVEGAINIPSTEIAKATEKLDNVPKDANILLYCRSGSRANTCKSTMERMGYMNITNGINKQHVEDNYL